jgi:uncharacterized membrane protein
MEKFSRSEAIKFGWKTMKKNFWFFVGLLIVACLIEIVPSGIANGLKNKVMLLYVIFTLIAWTIQTIVKMGLIKVALDVINKGTAEMGTLFSCTKLFWRFLGGSILYGLIVMGGFILLIVPGIIWAIKYQFFSHLIIDKNLGPIEALKKSAEITAGSKGNLFVLEILLMLINMLGVICLVIGLFATIPLSMVATAYVYRKLMGEMQAESVAPISSNTSPATIEPSA